MSEKTKKQQNFERGAIILLASTIIVKVIGAIFKIPLQHLIGNDGFGYFSSAYDLFLPIYALSMAGLPIAVAKMVSQSIETGRVRDAQRVFHVAQKLSLESKH